MANSNEPVVLELAPLPRDQIGPFLLLGLDKDAEPSEIDVTNRQPPAISTMVWRTSPPPKWRPAPRARLWNPAATADMKSQGEQQQQQFLEPAPATPDATEVSAC